jgi:uncharacterized secreted protein with C-terminal beta-propeller domain
LRVVAVLAVAVALAAAAPAAAARPHLRPRAFRSCAQLVHYARAHFAVTHGVPETAIGAASPAVPPNAKVAPSTGGGSSGPSFSTTNNQEAGVDEPDVVKTDGQTLFAVANGRVDAVAVGGDGAPRLLDALAVPNASQLLLHGSRLVVISGGGPVPIGLAASAPVAFFRPTTTVTELDVGNPAAMKITRTLTIDGAFVDARQNRATARLVISSQPRAVPLAGVRTKAAGWVPRRRFRSRLTGRHYVRAVAACTAIRHPVEFSGLGMVTILTINLDHGLYAADSDALMADAQVVYGSTDALYVATQKWIDPSLPVARVPARESTVIDRFDVTDPDRTTFSATGEVDGYLLNQFSLSEYKGDLRVATTSRPMWWEGGTPSASQSQVTVLRPAGGAVNKVGQVSGLGKGQQIYSVRFVDDVGYVVTFRQIDPLYTIDLSNPAAPRVAGQLELEGYSSYLHPLGNGLLLGIGEAVRGGNRPAGTQIELFDVHDPANPQLAGRIALGDDASSPAQFDHHAFLYWPPTGLAVLPVQIGDAFDGALGIRVGPTGLTQAGRVDQTGVQRAVVVGDRMFTVSDAGVMASSLATLAREAFVAFPTS